MAGLEDFLPITVETAATIRARMDADVNAGLDPSDPRWMDTSEGGFYADMAQVFALEAERLWDFLGTEVAGAGFPAYSWGSYLDEHGAVVGVTRKPATRSTGSVTFAGTNGTLIATGTIVSTTQPDADTDPVEFRTTASGTIASGTAVIEVEAVEEGSAGNVAASSVTVLLSPMTGVTSVTNAAAISGGADVETDEALRARILLEYQASQGAGTASDYERWALEVPGVGFATCEPLWAGAGTVRVIVTDPNNDPVSQPVIDAVQALLDPPAFTTTTTGSHTLPVTPINVVTTVGLRAAPDKVVIDGKHVVSYTGLGGTTLTGATGGSGSVIAGSKVAQGGRGDGRAPIGAIVTVTTPTALAVTVAATIAYETGYSRDGTSGTIPLGDEIKAAITAYIDGLKPGADVIRNKVIAQIVDIRGVDDVTACTLNGAGTNAAVSAAQIASTSTITLS